MHIHWITLSQLPDLSQSTYGALPHGDPNALLGQFEPSLRMLHRLCSSYALQLRLSVRVDPAQPAGQRLGIAIGFAGEPQALRTAPLWSTWLATPLAPYFAPLMHQDGSDPWAGVSPTALGLMGCEVARMERYWALAELGDDTFVRHSELPDWLHAVYPWEGNASCRLMSVLQLMQMLGEPCAFTLALTPSEGEAEYEALHPLYASSLSRLAGGSQKDALGRTEFVKPGPVADQLRSLRQDLLDALRCEPCFTLQLRCYAPTRDAARLLADTVMAEAVSVGPHACWPLPTDLGFFEPAPSALVSLKPPPNVGLPPALARLPRVFALSEVTALFRLPVLFEGEQLDLRKETWPSLPGAGQRQVLLGHTLTPGQDGGDPVHLPLDALVKHTLVVGVPGSGKTNTLMSLARQVWVDHQVPFLVLEPAKREYRGLLNLPGCSGHVLLFAPGRSAPKEWLLEQRFNPLALRINPFEMPLGYSVAEHRAHLLRLFKAAFNLFNPLPAMVEQAITQAYAELGWDEGDLASAERVQRYRFPTMRRFVALVREQAQKTTYIGENAATVKAGVEYNLGRLVEPPLAQVFDCEHSSLPPAEWLQRPAIVELESLGEANANFVSLLLQTYLRETLTVLQEAEREAGEQREPGHLLRHLLFLEEAHNLIGPHAEALDPERANPKAAATAYVVKLLAEVRALGLGIVIGDQLPSALAPEVLKNTNIRICHRLSAPDDRSQMQESMNASALQYELMATQTSGQALVAWEGVRKPFAARVISVDGNRAAHNQPFSDKTLLLAVCHPSGAQVDGRFLANARMLFAAAHLQTCKAPYPPQGVPLAELKAAMCDMVEHIGQPMAQLPNLKQLCNAWLQLEPFAQPWSAATYLPVAQLLLHDIVQRMARAQGYVYWLQAAAAQGQAHAAAGVVEPTPESLLQNLETWDGLRRELAHLIEQLEQPLAQAWAGHALQGKATPPDSAAEAEIQRSLLYLAKLAVSTQASWPMVEPAAMAAAVTAARRALCLRADEARARALLEQLLGTLEGIPHESLRVTLPSSLCSTLKMALQTAVEHLQASSTVASHNASSEQIARQNRVVQRAQNLLQLLKENQP